MDSINRTGLMQNQAEPNGNVREGEGGKHDEFCLQAQNSNYPAVWRIQTTSHDNTKWRVTFFFCYK